MREIGILRWASVGDDFAELHKEMFGRRFRRIGRYVKLAQVGAARCLGDLPSDQRQGLGVYLGSGLGNTVDIVPLAHGMLHPTHPRASPIAFAGCVGNAAAFFLAQATGALGPNVTVSQEERTFEAALLEAILALRSGVVRHALVGGVDLVQPPDDEQRARLHLTSETGTLTEAAAFVLLGPSEGAPAVLDEVWFGGADRALDDLPVPATLLPGWRASGLEPADGVLLRPRETRLNPIATGLRMVDVLDGSEPVPHPHVVHVQHSANGGAARVRITLR